MFVTGPIIYLIPSIRAFGEMDTSVPFPGKRSAILGFVTDYNKEYSSSGAPYRSQPGTRIENHE